MNMAHGGWHQKSELEDIRSDIFSRLDRLRDVTEERGPYLAFGVVFLSLLLFGAILWYAYPHGGSGDEAVSAVPLVRADTEPYRFRPEDPGGMDIPYQDSTIFERLNPSGTSEMVESLLNKTEQITEKEGEAAPVKFEGAESLILENETTVVTEEPEAAAAALPPLPPVKPPAPAVKVSAPPVVTTKSGGYMVQLGSLASRADAETEWKRLQRLFPEELGGLTLFIQEVDLGQRGTFFRIKGGELDKTAAQTVCDRIGGRNPGGCILVGR